MGEFLKVLGAVLPVFAVVGAGMLMRRLNWLTAEADHSLLRITINVLSPCLILDSILHNDALKQFDNLLAPPLVGFATIGLGLGLAYLLQRSSGLTEPRSLRTFSFTTGVYNYGYISLPLALMLFNRETVGVLFVHNVGVEIAMWTIGLMLLRGTRTAGNWRQLINPPVAAILVALTLNYFNGQFLIPGFVMTGVHMLGQCAIPMGIILIGAIISDHFHEFHSASGWRVILVSSVARMGILPLVSILLAKYLPISSELKQIIILQAAMPAAVFPIVMARHYGGDAPTAVRIALGTSLVGLITIPLWIRFGMAFVGF